MAVCPLPPGGKCPQRVSVRALGDLNDVVRYNTGSEWARALKHVLADVAPEADVGSHRSVYRRKN